MIKLIKNELFKVFHRKSIYVFAILILLFCLLNNILYKINYDEEGNYIETGYIDNTKQDYLYLETLDPNNPNEVDEYIDVKTNYDLEKLVNDNNFSSDSWQRSFSYEYLMTPIYNINYYTYKEQDGLKKLENENEYQFLLDKINNNDWQYFVNIKLDNVNKEISDLKSYETDLNTTLEIKNQEERLYSLNFEKELLEYRLKNNISYSNNYLNSAIIGYEDSTKTLYYMDKDSTSYDERLDYQKTLSANATYKYILDNKQNILKENNLKTGLKDIIIDYEIFIMIFIIVIASSIVSSEFKDGTIKQLLTKPYTRNKILLSKYLTCLISLGIIILYTIICEFIIGSICFGFDSLEIPVLIYNYNTNNLVEYNVIIYMLLIIVCKLPKYILMLTLAFSVSTVFNSTSLANTLSILGYLFSDMIYLVYISFNIRILKYFVTFNWDFTEYLYNKLPTLENLTLNISVIVCLFYYLIMMIVAFLVFKKKNIKNI